MDEKDFWPAMGRCDDCGRFMKRGLVNWMDHVYGDCPLAERNTKFKEDLLEYVHENGTGYLQIAIQNGSISLSDVMKWHSHIITKQKGKG